MSYPYLIPGEVSLRSRYSDSRPHSPFLKIVVAVWLLAGVALIVWKITLHSSEPSTVTVQPVPVPPVTAITSEDFVHHMEIITDKVTGTIVRLNRVQDQITYSLPAVERNRLWLEKQKLQTALATTQAAHRDLEEARQNTNLILNSLKEHLLK